MADFKEDVSAAAALLLPFVAFSLVLLGVSPPTSAELLSSDPIVQLVASTVGVWAVPAISAVPAVAWLVMRPPSGDALLRATRGAAAGLGLACVGLLLLRAVLGPTLPAFVPPEESALPGMALGVGAGVFEESVFRLGLLALVFVQLRRVASHGMAAAGAVISTALVFAAAHELGPGAGGFDLRFFATRFLIPGCGMSALFFRPGPAFLVTLHASAHVVIAVLFTGAR